jgi:hypothetical protein
MPDKVGKAIVAVNKNQLLLGQTPSTTTLGAFGGQQISAGKSIAFSGFQGGQIYAEYACLLRFSKLSLFTT